MSELVLWSAVGLAAVTVGLFLYSAGSLYRFRRLTALRAALEARCATLRDEAEGQEAVAQELARVRAQREALQEERASVQRELEARAQKKAQEGEWVVVRPYSAVTANELLRGLHAQVEATLTLLWFADKEKERPLRHIALVCCLNRSPATINKGHCEFQGRSWEEWKAYRAREDQRCWNAGPRYYVLFHYQTKE